MSWRLMDILVRFVPNDVVVDVRFAFVFVLSVFFGVVLSMIFTL